MPRIKIDNYEIEVPEGTSVLEAARRLGIDIPTLCWVKDCAPTASCLVCEVRDKATGRTFPSCATRVVDGMDIESESETIHKLRRTSLELLLGDHRGDCIAPCTFGCPARMDIPGMLRAIETGRMHEAIEIVKGDIALPAVLGRICPAPCEKVCRRRSGDSAISICGLKRYVADVDLAGAEPWQPKIIHDTGRRVAVLGAGPAGMSAVYYLQRAGVATVLIDKKNVRGGRLRGDYDAKILPPEVLDAELATIMQLGVDWRGESEIADATALDALCKEFDAVVLAVGAVDATQCKQLGLEFDRKGIAADRKTFQTSRPGLFAAGEAIRGGRSMVIRSAADGKEVAMSVVQYLNDFEVIGSPRPFTVRLPKFSTDEATKTAEIISSSAREEPPNETGFSEEEALRQASRCFQCGCPDHNHCRLEQWSEAYHASPKAFPPTADELHHTDEIVARITTHRRDVRFVDDQGQEQTPYYDPGKCIACELCVQIAETADESLGISLIGRGFAVRVGVPFDRPLQDALAKVAKQCVDACPTGALTFIRKE